MTRPPDLQVRADAPSGSRPASAGSLPSSPPPPAVERRFQPRALTADGVIAAGGSMASALGLTWVEFERLLPTSGIVGFWVCWYVTFLVLYAAVTWTRTRNRLAVVDQTVAALVAGAGLVLVGVLALIIVDTAGRGYHALRPNFFTQDMSAVQPADPLTKGGAAHAIVGTLEMVGIGVLIAVPLGISTGLYLNEVGGRLARTVRTVVDAMSALPSVVAGLFIYIAWIVTFGYPKSGFAAALALTIMMMPIITRTAEVVFRLVPGGLREASYALGAPQWRTVLFVVLPTARASLITAVILGVARGIGETSPVLLTAGFTSTFNYNPLKGAQVSLPLYVFNYVRFPTQVLIERAYGAAFTLLALVLVLFVTARIIGGSGPGQVSRRQRRRAAAEGRRA